MQLASGVASVRPPLSCFPVGSGRVPSLPRSLKLQQWQRSDTWTWSFATRVFDMLTSSVILRLHDSCKLSLGMLLHRRSCYTVAFISYPLTRTCNDSSGSPRLTSESCSGYGQTMTHSLRKLSLAILQTASLRMDPAGEPSRNRTISLTHHKLSATFSQNIGVAGAS